MCGLREQKAYSVGDVFPYFHASFATWAALDDFQDEREPTGLDTMQPSFFYSWLLLSCRKLPSTCCRGQMLLRLVNMRLKYTGTVPAFFWRSAFLILFSETVQVQRIHKKQSCKYGDKWSAIFKDNVASWFHRNICKKKNFFINDLLCLHDFKYLQITFSV